MDILTAFTHEEIECEALKCPAWIVREKSTFLCNVVAKLSPSLPFVCANCTLKGKADPCVHCLYVKENFHFIVDPLDYPEDPAVLSAVLDSCVTLQLMLDEIDTRSLIMLREKLYNESPVTPVTNVQECEMEFLESTEVRVLKNVEAEYANRSISRFAMRTFRRHRQAWDAMVDMLSKWAMEYNRKNREIVRECQKVSEGEEKFEEKENTPPVESELEVRESDLETVPPQWEPPTTFDCDTDTDEAPVEDTIV